MDEPQAYTVDEFCRAHGISRALFYILAKKGKAPDIMRAGRRVLIPAESARQWRERLTEEEKREAVVHAPLRRAKS